MTKQRINYLDVAKGIGILLMIFGHIDRGGIIQTWIYSFHMPLFFIVSGIISYKKISETTVLKNDIVKKIKGLLYPYFMFSLLTMIYVFLVGLVLNHNVLQALSQVKECFFETIMFFGYGNLWFIPCFFLSGVVFRFLCGLKKEGRVSIELIFFFTVVMAFRRYPYGNIQYSFFTVFIKSLVGVLLMQLGFYLGKLIDYFKLINNYRNTVFLAIISTVVHSLLFIANGKRLVDLNTINLGNPLIYLMIAFNGATMVICLSILLEKIDKIGILKFFGGGKRSFIFLAVNNFTVITAICEKISSLFLSSNTYTFMVCFFVVLIESFIVWVVEKYFYLLFDFGVFKSVFNLENKKEKY